MAIRRLRVGLTGGIASGKSTVAQRFEELGVSVIDADVLAREVVEPGQSGLEQVVAEFGSGVLTSDGRLDRRALRNLIFADSRRRKRLENILHPLIRAEMELRAEAACSPYLVLAIPLLVEGGDFERIDRILVIDVDEAVQRSRLMERDSSPLPQANAIIAAQAPRQVRLDRADDVLFNNGTIDELRAGVDTLHEGYLSLAATRPM